MNLKKQVDELKGFKEKCYYLTAEMQNLEKRMRKEKEDTIKFGQERILTDLLDVLDNFVDLHQHGPG